MYSLFITILVSHQSSVRKTLIIFVLYKIKRTCIQLFSYVQKCPTKQWGINICICTFL